MNAFVIVLGICCATAGWRQPAVALTFPAFMLVNGILFQIVPVIVTRIVSPGLSTFVVLFVPIGICAYRGAGRERVRTTSIVIPSVVIGFLLMMFPIVLQKTKRPPFFSQAEPPRVIRSPARSIYRA